jgi:hypothetical protein
MRASALRHARFPVSPFLAGLSPGRASPVLRWSLLSHQRYYRSVAGRPAAGRAKLPCPRAVKLIRLVRTAVVAPPTPFCTRISFNRFREEALNGQPVPQLRGV